MIALRRAALLRELSTAAWEAAEGNTKSLEQVQLALKQLDNGEIEEVEDDFNIITADLEELLQSAVLKPGLRWRLSSLNRHLGSLRKGDFGFVFARPETGKTTFLTSENSFFLEQADGPIIHANNEEQGEKVKLRYYQAVLGWTMEQIYNNVAEAEKQFKAKTQGKLLLLDQSTIHHKQIERLCNNVKPALIIYDQIDKIMGFDSDRNDLRLGAIYQWARQLAKQYCPTIGVCQADGSGENVKWLTMANVADAKTSKQAEADWILGIGKIHDTGYEALRFLHLSKNKLMGDPDTDHSNRHAKWEALIRPEIARYQDLK